ncbi:MAG: hypothetical protein FWE10_00990 [Rikenellaceae bacterium]|nr:hypothetical protein [Rikenellaceae bacterium]MCL2692312.1 hypothetical protein [Rikenellaceae bacterium]
MGKIEQAKSYTGQDLDNIFFRPMFSGPDANALGIRIMHNMPVPTTLQFWRRAGDILQKYTTGGWSGAAQTERFQKTMDLKRVKAEVGYGADEYYNLVFGLITNSSEVNMGDLTGTELERAETAIFKEAIAESIRATMWVGDTARSGAGAQYNTFDGFMKRIAADIAAGETAIKSSTYANLNDPDAAETLFRNLWENASPMLRDFKSQGNLAYFVTSDVYARYEDALDSMALDSAYLQKQTGREGLYFRGIPVIDLQISGYLAQCPDMPQSFAILTDRRNLALAVNTSDFPGTEVKMWYNPDAMENRQRAVFMAGCDYLMPELISYARRQ